MPEIGDVMRWDRAWEQDLKDPLWCMVTGKADDDGDDWHDMNLCGGTDLAAHRFQVGKTGEFSWPSDERYAFAVIVPPEEWPDEVCTAVALYKLGVLDDE